MATVLLIEDNGDVLENASEILEMASYHVLKASDGNAGIRAAIEQQPDLIICDISMPGMDGYGVLGLLRQTPATQAIPFIFMTGKSGRQDIRRGMELGADDYITKPFSATELLDAIESRLKRMTRVNEASAAAPRKPEEAENDGLLQSLKEGRDIKRYKKKQLIYAEGSHPSYLFYILKGKVKTSKRNEEGKELITGLYGADDFLGHSALLEDSVYKEDAEAMEETEAAVIPRGDFEELVAGNVSLMKKFIRLLSKDIAEKEEQLPGLAYHSLRKKVADALLSLNRKYNAGTGGPFSITISRDNLASVAGVAKESLIRTLSDFKSEKLIDITEGEIFITDLKKLERMLN